LKSHSLNRWPRAATSHIIDNRKTVQAAIFIQLYVRRHCPGRPQRYGRRRRCVDFEIVCPSADCERRPCPPTRPTIGHVPTHECASWSRIVPARSRRRSVRLGRRFVRLRSCRGPAGWPTNPIWSTSPETSRVRSPGRATLCCVVRRRVRVSRPSSTFVATYLDNGRQKTIFF